GVEILDGHPYARDLDLFGRASLFEPLDTGRTEAGEETLAGWLRAAPLPSAAIDEVRARQEAVDEFRPMVDFREELSVLATETPVGRTGVLAAWAVRAPVGFAPGVRFLFAACAVVTASLVGAAINGAVDADVLTAWLVVPLTVA